MVHGGPSRAILTMEKALRDRGITVVTLTTDDDGPGRRLIGSVNTRGNHCVYARKWTDFYKIAPGLVPWLIANIRHFDVVHIHALYSFASVAAAVIARRAGIPYVLRPLGTLGAYGMQKRRRRLKRLSFGLIEGPLLRDAARVHFTSDREMREAAALGVPLRGVVIPLAVEASAGNARSKEPALPDGKILFLSRLDPMKNVEGLLRALQILESRGRRPFLAIAGDGAPDYVSGLRRFACNLGLTGRVEWLGAVDGARKVSAFAAADIFVLPSFSENFGIAAVEAMMCEIACVLARGVAIASDLEMAQACVVCTEDPASIADAITLLLSSELRRRAIAKAGKLYAETHFSVSAMSDRLIDLYESVVSK